MIAVFRTLIRLFLTGAATLLPFVVTLFIVSWGVMLADAYIGPSSNFGLFIVKVVGPDYKYLGYLVGYFVAIGLIILLGFLVTRATVARIQGAIDSTVCKNPPCWKNICGSWPNCRFIRAERSIRIGTFRSSRTDTCGKRQNLRISNFRRYLHYVRRSRAPARIYSELPHPFYRIQYARPPRGFPEVGHPGGRCNEDFDVLRFTWPRCTETGHIRKSEVTM